MNDDGQHGDGAAGDGLYGATIPPNTAKPGQMLRYYVACQDEAGQVSRWPLFPHRQEYSAYEGLVISEALPTRLPVLHLFITKEPALGSRSGGVTASIVYQGELYDNISLRSHGQFSRSFPKKSYNLRFPRDHAFHWHTNQPAVRKLKLLSNYADKSKIRNTLAYEMIAASGSQGHFAFPVRVQKNGKFFSVTEVVESGDEQWLERIGRDPQGALYKMNNNLSGAHGGEKKTRQYESARDLASLASALSEQRPMEERAFYAYRNIDIPQCVSYFVAMALISSDDHGHKNYYLYRDSRHTGEWALLPWDVDLSWGRDWTGQYFNESTFVDNPLDFYRSDRHKPRNRLYDLFYRYPDFRQMYLRRLRTVMDQLLQPPGTPAKSLIIEERIRELMDQMDPPGIKPSDADLDAAWPSWGQESSMRKEATRIITEYLPGRRQFLFKSSRAKLFGEPIPGPQPADATLEFGTISLEAAPPDQFVCLTNRNTYAVDMSGWRLAGGGIDHQFRPGTVVPPARSIYVASHAVRLRRNPPEGTDQAPWFVQGNWTGSLSSEKGPLRLINSAGTAVISHTWR